MSHDANTFNTAGHSGLWRRARRRARALSRRYGRSDRGATAIEFGIVALIFFALIFGILELAIVFFTSSVLSHAVSDAGRSIRVGQFQNCGTEDEFRDLVCAKMKGFISCSKNLRVDVISEPQFRDVVMPDIDSGGINDADDDVVVANGQYDPNGAGSPVAVRATFYYPLVLPTAITRLESKNPSGGVIAPGRRIIVASTAFRNEPFPSTSTCDASVGDALSAS